MSAEFRRLAAVSLYYVFRRYFIIRFVIIRHYFRFPLFPFSLYPFSIFRFCDFDFPPPVPPCLFSRFTRCVPHHPPDFGCTNRPKSGSKCGSALGLYGYEIMRNNERAIGPPGGPSPNSNLPNHGEIIRAPSAPTDDALLKGYLNSPIPAFSFYRLPNFRIANEYILGTELSPRGLFCASPPIGLLNISIV